MPTWDAKYTELRDLLNSYQSQESVSVADLIASTVVLDDMFTAFSAERVNIERSELISKEQEILSQIQRLRLLVLGASSQSSTVSSVAAVRALTPTDKMRAYVIGGLPYVWKEGDTTTADNNALVLDSSVAGYQPGGNQEGRWIAQITSGAVNAKAWGVVADGVTDDAPALQKAFTDSAANGLKLILPSGTMLIGATGAQSLLIQDNLFVKGSTGSTIKLANATTAHMLVASGKTNATFANVTFDGNRANQTASGLLVQALISLEAECSYIRFSSCTFQNGIEAGLLGEDVAQGLYLDDCTFTSCGETNVNTPAIHIRRITTDSTFTKDIFITGCSIDNSAIGAGGIKIFGSAASASTGGIENVYVGGNKVLVGDGGAGVSTLGIELWTQNGMVVRNATVTGNTVRGPAGWAGNTYGISVATSGMRNVAVSGNAVWTVKHGIELYGQSVTATGNSFHGCGFCEIGAVDGASFSGNTIYNALDTNYALRFNLGAGASNDLSVANNVFVSPAGNAIGLGAAGGAVTWQRIHISGNSLMNCGTNGIALSDANLTVNDLVIVNNQMSISGSGAYRGVFLNASVASRITVSGNVVDGQSGAEAGFRCQTADVLDLAVTNNIVKNMTADGLIVLNGCQGLAVHGNVFDTMGSDGVQANVGSGTNLSDVSIGLNTFNAITGSNYNLGTIANYMLNLSKSKLLADRGLGAGNAVANTNTPSGATSNALEVFDATGASLGFLPVYASQW